MDYLNGNNQNLLNSPNRRKESVDLLEESNVSMKSMNNHVLGLKKLYTVKMVQD